MSGSASRRLPANQVGLVFLLLLAAWLVFLYFPRRKEPPPPLAPVRAESRLRAVGLPDNVDLEALPEFFAIVADKAEWRDGKTRFGYWHPVMKTYSYYFEATRGREGFRFREIAEPHDPDHYWDEEVAEGSLIRFYYSNLTEHKNGPAPNMMVQPKSAPPKVEVDVDPPTLRPEMPVVPQSSKPKP